MYFKRLKKILVVLLLFLVQCSVCFATNTYSSAAIQLYNSGVAYQRQGKYEIAEQKYNRVLKIQPNFAEAKHNLAVLYQVQAQNSYSNENYSNAIIYTKKALKFKPNDVNSYEIMAQCYSAMQDYNNANIIYNKILKSNPNDKIAQQNLKYVSYQHSEKVLTESLNNISIGHIAPNALYKLIKPSPGIDANTVEQMKTILDLVWSEPNGQHLLQTLMIAKTPINIGYNNVEANAQKTQKQRTFYAYGFIPVFTYTSNSNSVNISFNYISDFNNPNLEAHNRIYDLQVFIHEFGHAFMNVKKPKGYNSIEEELGVSMIGYNIANKVLTGKYLDRKQTELYSMGCLQSLLGDNHRNLPVYGNFNNFMQGFGVLMPYPEVYSNLPSMYKKLLSEGKVNPVPSFNQYLR